MSEGYILDEPYATEMKGCLVSTKDYIYILRNKCRDLQQKVEQLEKDKSYANWYAVKKEKEVEQLENIRKEAIEYMKTLSDEYAANDYDIKCEIFKKLFYDILNKGSDK